MSVACTNCAAALKLLKSFAGKTIKCPKCSKKTLVPGDSVKEEQPAARSAAPAAPAAPPVEAVSLPSVPAPAAAPEPPVAAAPLEPSAAPAVCISEPAPAPAVSLPPPAPGVPAPAPAAPAPAASAPAPVSAAPAPVAAPAPALAPAPAPAPAVDLTPRLHDQEQKIEQLMRQMREMDLRLDIERLKAEKAMQEKQALASLKATERLHLQEELSVHFKAEMVAAQQTISRLEEKIRTATEQRLETPPPGTRTAAQIEKELLENPDETMMESETAVPDAVMAQIRDSPFGRYVRTAVLIHVVLLVVTSIGMIRGYFVKPPPAEGEGAVTNVVTAVSAPVANADAQAASPASATVRPAPAAAEVKPAAAVEKTAAKPAAANPLEALPAPGEKPPAESQVDLGL